MVPGGSRSIGCGHLGSKRERTGTLGRGWGCIGRAEQTGGIGRLGTVTGGTKVGVEKDTFEEMGAEEVTGKEMGTDEGTDEGEINEEGRLGIRMGLGARRETWRCL